MRDFFVYILASKSRRLYVGVTNDLKRRMYQHVRGQVTFTSRYRINRLVYFETTGNALAAIEREKQIKGWLRAKKIALIQTMNPTWADFAEAWQLRDTPSDPSRSLSSSEAKGSG